MDLNNDPPTDAALVADSFPPVVKPSDYHFCIPHGAEYFYIFSKVYWEKHKEVDSGLFDADVGAVLPPGFCEISGSAYLALTGSLADNRQMLIDAGFTEVFEHPMA